MRRGRRRAVERTVRMWVFDGEQWTEEGSEQRSKAEQQKPQVPYGEMMPELQVIEIVQIPKSNPIPPFPLP